MHQVDSKKIRFLLEAINIELIMKVFGRNKRVQNFVIIKANMTHIFML